MTWSVNPNRNAPLQGASILVRAYEMHKKSIHWRRVGSVHRIFVFTSEGRDLKAPQEERRSAWLHHHYSKSFQSGRYYVVDSLSCTHANIQCSEWWATSTTWGFKLGEWAISMESLTRCFAVLRGGLLVGLVGIEAGGRLLRWVWVW